MKTNWKEMIGALTFLIVGILFTILDIYGIVKEKNIADIIFIGMCGVVCLMCGTLWVIFTYDFFIVDYEEPIENFKKVIFSNKYLLVNIQTNKAYELPVGFISKDLKYVKIRFCYDIRKNFKTEQFNLHHQVFVD